MLSTLAHRNLALVAAGNTGVQLDMRELRQQGMVIFDTFPTQYRYTLTVRGWQALYNV